MDCVVGTECDFEVGIAKKLVSLGYNK